MSVSRAARFRVPDAGHDEGADQTERNDGANPDPSVGWFMTACAYAIPAVGLENPAEPRNP